MRAASILAGVLICVAALSAAESPIKVIAHPGVKISHVSSEELKEVFLGTRTSLADGSHVEPVLLKAGGAHDAFVKQYTGKTTAGLENYYRSLVFTGKGAMPKTFASDVDMVAYVKRTKGAIGYVSAGAGTAGVVVLDVQ